MQNTDKRGALKNSSKDNTYKKKIDSAKSKADSAVRSPEFTKGNHAKNLTSGKKFVSSGKNPRIVNAPYNSKEHSAYGSSLKDRNLGSNHAKGKPQSSLYMGNDLSKNYKRGQNQSTYYRGNTLNVNDMTSEVEGQGV